MYRRWFLGIGLALAAGITFGQTAPAEADTLRSLLSEVRQLRQALETTTVTAQRIQITLYRMQVQAVAVSQATQRLDEARAKVAEAERWRERLTHRVEDTEKIYQSHKEDQRERAAIELDLHREKKELERRTNEEQQLRTIESEASAQVQAEQAKLGELQDGLERLDKTVANQSQP